MIDIDNVLRYRLKLSKTTDASCHEFIQVLANAVEQSGLKYHTKNGRVRVYVFSGALRGEESTAEIAEIFLLEQTSLKEINLKLSPFLEGSGFKIINVEQLPYRLCSLQNLVQYANYKITGVEGNITQAISGASEELKTQIYSLARLSEDEISLIISLKPFGSISTVQEFLMLPGLEVKEGKLKVLRTSLFWIDKKGTLQCV